MVNYPWLAKYVEQIGEEIRCEYHAHAYLLHGRTGVGKTYLASNLARIAVCESIADNPFGCGRCRSCTLNDEENHPDIKYLQVEGGASQITVEQSRDLIEFYTLKSHYGLRRVGLILNADRLNRNAANALLKIVEEPPANAIIFLTASKIAYIPLTLRSRCRKVFVASPDRSSEKRWLDERRKQDSDVRNPDNHTLQGGPLDKLRFLKSEETSPLDMFSASLHDIFKGDKSIVHISEDYSGIDPTLFLDCCESVLMILTTLKFESLPLNLDVPEKRMIGLVKISNLMETAKIFSIHDTISESRKLLARSTGIKTTDIVEEIFFSFAPTD